MLLKEDFKENYEVICQSGNNSGTISVKVCPVWSDAETYK